MGKYTADDNRSMQLNDNNDRYWSSRGIDIDDFIYDDDDTNNLSKGNKIMFIEINNKLINLAHVHSISTEVNKVDVKRHAIEWNRKRPSRSRHLAEIIPEFTITFTSERWEEKVMISAKVHDPDRIGDTHYPNRGRSYCNVNYSCYIPDVDLRLETKLSYATIVYGDEDFDQQAIKKEIEASSHGLTHAFIKALCRQHNPESQ